MSVTRTPLLQLPLKRDFKGLWDYMYLLDLILYVPVNNVSVMSGRVFLG